MYVYLLPVIYEVRLCLEHTYSFKNQEIGESEVWRSFSPECRVRIDVLYGHALHNKWEN